MGTKEKRARSLVMKGKRGEEEEISRKNPKKEGRKEGTLTSTTPM